MGMRVVIGVGVGVGMRRRGVGVGMRRVGMRRVGMRRGGMRVPRGMGAAVAADEFEDEQGAQDKEDGGKELPHHVGGVKATVLTILAPPLLHHHHTLGRPKKVEAEVESISTNTG